MTETDADTAPPRWTRLGLIVGGGELPQMLARAEPDAFIVRLLPAVDAPYDDHDSVECSMGQIGKAMNALKAAGCDAICFAGYAPRPNLDTLRVDARGALFLPKALAAARKGDDALLQSVLSEFRKAGFGIVGAHEVLAGLTPDEGVLGAVSPDENSLEDARKAMEIARAIGDLDIGQGAVVAKGLVLAVEAQEGTDAMLERVATLSEGIRIGAVLAKSPKPIQDRRIDLPTIGVGTVERAATAGLAGIAVEADGALFVDRDAVIAAADAAGLFIIALKAEA